MLGMCYWGIVTHPGCCCKAPAQKLSRFNYSRDARGCSTPPAGCQGISFSVPQHQEKKSRELLKKWFSPLKQKFWRFPSFLPSSLARNRLLRSAPFSSAQLSCSALSAWFPVCCSWLDDLEPCGGRKKLSNPFVLGY